MFGKKKVSMDKIDTIVGSETKFEGKIESKGTVRIDGTLIGDIAVEGHVILGQAGRIKGNVTCENLSLSGAVEGNVLCREKLHITNSGKLYGDMDVKCFIVDENGVFEGHSKMRPASPKKMTVKGLGGKESQKDQEVKGA